MQVSIQKKHSNVRSLYIQTFSSMCELKSVDFAPLTTMTLTLGLEELQFLITPILLLAPIFIFLLGHRLSKAFTKSNLPSGPCPWPIIGNLPHIRTKPAHVATAQLAKIHGPLISLRLGSQLVVVASSPAAAMEILKTQDRILSGRYVPHVSYAKPADRNYVSVGWTYECTEQWKFLRTLCRNHLFSSKAINDQAKVRETKVHETIEYLRSKEGHTVNIGEVIFASALNSLGSILFSKDFMSIGEDGDKGVSGITRRIVELLAAPNISDLYPILGRLDLQGLQRRADKCCRKLCGLWEPIIRQRRDEGKSYHDNVRKYEDFLEVLLENQFSDDQINYLILVRRPYIFSTFEVVHTQTSIHD